VTLLMRDVMPRYLWRRLRSSLSIIYKVDLRQFKGCIYKQGKAGNGKGAKV
jgi:hypothetical protein